MIEHMKLFVFLVSLALFALGFWLFGWAFSAVGYEAIVFFSGIIAVAVGIAIPVHLLKRIDG
jgi:cytochrome c oxidase assembly factor CtaG